MKREKKRKRKKKKRKKMEEPRSSKPRYGNCFEYGFCMDHMEFKACS